jgi:hypothetical protein
MWQRKQQISELTAATQRQYHGIYDFSADCLNALKLEIRHQRRSIPACVSSPARRDLATFEF